MIPIDPCGVGMDLLRSCYSTRMRFYRNSLRSAPVRWFFCTEGAPIYPGYQRFASLNYDDREETAGHLGEVKDEPRPYYLGTRPVPAPELTPCGPAEVFAEGGLWPQNHGLPRIANGLAGCCVPGEPIKVETREQLPWRTRLQFPQEINGVLTRQALRRALNCFLFNDGAIRTVGLFSNLITPTIDTTIGDLVVVTGNGLSPKDLAPWNPTEDIDDGEQRTLEGLCTLFACDENPPEPITVWGYWVGEADSAALWWVHLFEPGPIVISGAGQSILICPVVQTIPIPDEEE